MCPHRASIRRPAVGRIAAVALVCAAGVIVPAGPAAASCGDAPAPGVDWSDCDFAFADLADVSLANATMRNIDLSYAVLFRADLRNADLRGADLSDAFPIAADLSGANLTDADLSDADLVGARLDGAILRRTVLSRSDVDLASIAGASFLGADLTGADLDGVSGASSATFALPPETTNDRVVTWSNSAVVFDVLANDDTADVNPFAAERVEIVSGPANGTFDLAAGRYTPRPNFDGDDRITYRLVHTLPWTNLPDGVATTYTSELTTVEIEVKRRVRLQPPYAGAGGIEGEVARLYVALMRRQPDRAGFDFWVGQRRNGVSLRRVAAVFQDSPEFRSLYSDLSDEEFVTLLYANVLERRPDANGLAFWVGQLRSGGFDRNEVTLAFSESPEFLTLTGTS